jgi:hypothetical protein
MSGAVRIIALGAAGGFRDVPRIDPALDNADWYLFADRDAVLNPELAALLRTHGARRPDIDIFHGDEVIVDGSGQVEDYLCKPAFDPTCIIAHDYIGLPLAVRARAMAALGPPDATAGSARYYDLLLRAVSREIGIDRITEVLAVNPARRFQGSIPDRLSVLRRLLPGLVPGCEILPGLTEGTFEIRRVFDAFPEITLVIPTRQARPPAGVGDPSDRPMILGLLEGIARSDWPMDRMRVLIGDDVEDGSIYESRAWPFRLVRVATGRGTAGFNYALKINALWRAAETEHLIILNDDLVVRDPGWIKALMTFAVDESVGGVGARLLYPDGRIQHAGMAAGLMGICGHVFIGSPESCPTYQDWALVQREWSMVTGAVFATRRGVLEQVNGFDERFSLDYNDVDLCLRLRLLGYRIVYTPHAVLTHFESASRGKAPIPPDQTALFAERWREYLLDDPAYHPNLTRTSPDIRPVIPAHPWWGAIATAPSRTGF